MKLCDLLTAKILNSYKNIIVLQKDKNSAAGGIILEVEKDKQKEKCCYYGIYSLSMCGIFCIILFIFMKNGKSFIHKGDGMQQHYIALEYWGNYLRQIIRDLVFAHRLNIPQWNLHIGNGADILTTLHYYVIGDPLNLLAVLVPSRYTEYLYAFLCFLRYYLAGITFSMYCFYNKNKKLPVFLGSLIYVYSQWMIVTGLDHPYFMNPVIYLPLIMLGIDRIYDRKKPYLYIWTIVLSAVSNFYFFYMLAVFTVIYVVFRYFTKHSRFILREFAGMAGKIGIYTMIALMISSPVLLPIIKTMMGNSRMNVQRYMPILYSRRFYVTLLAAFSGASNKTRFSYIGVAGVCVLAIIVLFMQKGKYLSLKLGTALVTAMVCIPLAGRIMNGFSYTTNRWTWACSMLFSYIFVKMFQEFFGLTTKKKIILAAIVSLYSAFLIFYPHFKGKNNGVAGILLLCMIAAFLTGYRFLANNKKRQAIFFTFFIVLSVGTNIWFYYNGSGRGHKNKTIISAYVNRGRAYGKCHSEIEDTIKELPNSSLVRVDQRNINTLCNTSMLNEINAGKFRFSIAPEGTGTFFNEVYMNSSMDQIFYSLNSRTWLSKLFSVKYFLAKEGIVPYGVVKKSEETGQKDRILYTDPDSLPFAYTYDSYIPVSSYMKMNPVQRQEALMQGVVLKREDAEGMEKTNLSLHVKEIPYSVHDMKDMTWKNGLICAEKKDASCVLTFKGETNSETYVTFDGLSYKGKNKTFRTVFEKKDNVNADVKIVYPHDGEMYTQSLRVLSIKDNFGSGRTNYGMNLLYNEKPMNEVKLVFATPGKYKTDSIRIFAQKMDGLSELTEERRTEAPEDLTVDGDHICCTVNFSKERELVFTIPYSPGWKLYVDGVKQETNKANRMFLGSKISKGSHRIELDYTTPGLPEGLCLMWMGFFLLLLLWKKSDFHGKKRNMLQKY